MDFETALPYLIAVYIGIWAGVLAYLFLLQGKISNLNKQVDALSKAVEKKTAKEEPKTVSV